MPPILMVGATILLPRAQVIPLLFRLRQVPLPPGVCGWNFRWKIAFQAVTRIQVSGCLTSSGLVILLENRESADFHLDLLSRSHPDPDVGG